MKRHPSSLLFFTLYLFSVEGGQYDGLTRDVLNDMSRECILSVSQWAPKVTFPSSDPISVKRPVTIQMPSETILTDYTRNQESEHNYYLDENGDYIEDYRQEFNPQSSRHPEKYNPNFNPVMMQEISFHPQMPQNPYKLHAMPQFSEHNTKIVFQGPVQKGIKDVPENVPMIPPKVTNVLPAGWPIPFSQGHEEIVTGPVRMPLAPKVTVKKPHKGGDNANDMMAAFKTAGKEAMQVAWGAIVSEEVTKRVAKKLHLNKENIAKDLPDFDISGTEIVENCITPLEPSFNNLEDVVKAKVQVPKCAYKRYRTQNGYCNNLLFMRRGNSMVKFNRGLPPDYSDGISAPRVGKSGRPLPSPRLITNFIVRDGFRPDRQITHLVMQWGQFIDHDISHTTEWKGSDDDTLDCCEPKNAHHPQCFPIPIPRDDPFYSHFGNSCMPVTRSLPAPRPGCTLGPREQLNQITSFIDASNVYGSSDEKTHKLRAHIGGRLKVMPLDGQVKEVLPNLGGDPRECPYMKVHSLSDQCSFEAGDARLNLKVTLTTLHIIFLREHNRIAGALERINPHWNDEIIFQETRRIVGAMMQQIIYAEYLPWLLGEAARQWDLELLPDGYYKNYDVFTDPGVYNEFATAAYRYGHSLVNARLDRYNYMNQKIPSNDTWVSDHTFKPFDLYYPGRIDEYLRGLLIENAQTFDNLITSQLTNWLFKPSKNAPGLDLAAINIQRGRDHGLPGYNYWRSLCGLKPAKNFKDLEQYMIPGQAQQFSQIYEYVDDIDLFPAGISELPVKGGILGPVFACIIGKQFQVIRQGDRFWYENFIPLETGLSHGFPPEQLAELRKVKLSRIICVNSDAIEIIQVNALLKAHPKSNPIVRCEELKDIDLSKWKNADNVPVRRPKNYVLADLLANISPASKVPVEYRG